MENLFNLPVGKRTRNQIANRVKEQNKRARLAARKEWMKRKEKEFVGKNGGKLGDDNVKEEEEDDVIIIISKDEFDGESNCSGSEVKEEVFDDDFDHRGLKFDDGKGKKIMYDDDDGKEGCGSDDSSVVFLGERFDPSVLRDDDLNDDDGDGIANGNNSESKGVMKGNLDVNSCEEKRIDGENSSSSEEDDVGNDRNYDGDDEDVDFDGEYEEEDDDDGGGGDGEDDDVNDDDVHSCNHDIILIDSDDANEIDAKIERIHVGGVIQPTMSIYEVGVEKVKRREREEIRKRGRPPKVFNGLDAGRAGLNSKLKDMEQPSPIDKASLVGTQETQEKRKRGRPRKNKDVEQPSPIDEGQEVGPKSENGEKRKRGRPRKNKDVEEFSCSSSKNEFLCSSSKNEFLCSSSKNGGKNLKHNIELQNTLLHTILVEGNEGLDDILSHTNECYLPLKFRYGINEKIVPEKTEEEVEEDSLFKDFEFALQAHCIGVDDSPIMKENEDEPSKKGVVSQEVLCSKGKHDLIHDEEIGTVCKFCSYVELEIKYVMPDFNKYPFGKKDSRDYYRFPNEDNLTYDGFEFPDSSSDCLGEHPNPSDDIPGTVWDLIPGVRRKLYPHQRDGFEFIWRNVAGGIKMDELGKASEVGLGGCIVCHAPGTGKTRLAIVFLQSFMKKYRKVKPVIVAPYSMLRTWEEELAKWNVDIPFFNLNENELTGKEDPKILKYIGNVLKDKKSIRFVKLMTWASGAGVLAVSYGLLQRLAGEKEGTDEKVREVLLKQPGIVFLDEGHTPRNENSNIWQVLSDLSTKRRVILSGTPFQNNFEELHNTISLVREEFGGPVLSGYYEQDDRRIQELRQRIIPFVHVHKGEILKETLKGLFHSLLILKPSLLQKKCFDLLIGIRNRFKYDNLVSITAVHPSILSEKKLPFIDKELEDLLIKHRMDRYAGVKTVFLVELIKLSKGERVLVFGQYLPPLYFIADLLKYVFQWTMGNEVLYMDGKQDVHERQNCIRLFNDPTSEARVLLASIRACSEGIHLVGASRVVLLDVVWNPSVERQAISRAYRLGQQKDVFVYHLLTSGTLEEEKYHRQATKERLSELVFSSSEECVQKSTTRSRISEDRVLQEMTDHENLKHIFNKIIYQPKADNLIESFDSLNF